MNDKTQIKGVSAISRALRQRIQRGEWTANSVIPGEEQLALEYCCSRMTMNKAIMTLVDEGLLERRRKAGTRVLPQNSWQASYQLPRIRHHIEQTGKIYDYRLLDRREMPAEGELAAILHLEEYRPVLYLRCLHLGNNRVVMCEDHWMNADILPDSLEESFYQNNPDSWIASRFPSCEAAHRISATATDQVLARQMSLTTGTALFVVERQLCVLGQYPSFCRQFYPANNLTLSMPWM